MTMSRVWPIALIVIAVVVIGVFAADTLGIIRVPSILSGPTPEEVAAADEGEDIEEDLGDEEELDRPRRPRRKPKKKKAKPEPAKKVEAPPPKPVKKGPRLSMPSPSSITTSRLPDDLNRDTIHTAIARQVTAFQRCLKDAIKAGDDLPNRVLVSMTASTQGKITENHIKDRTVERSTIGRCVLRKSGSIRFPMFSGDPVTIAFPLMILKD
jgi:hypothetical protein